MVALIRTPVPTWVRDLDLLLLGLSLPLFALDAYHSLFARSECDKNFLYLGAEVQRVRRNIEVSCTKPNAYKHRLSTDDHGRRRVPATPAAATQSILFLGCSYTIGMGVNGNETFANIAQARLGSRHLLVNAA